MLMHKLMAYLVTDVLKDMYGVGNYSFGDDCGTVSGRRSLFMETSPRDFILVGVIETNIYGVGNILFTQDDVVSLTINEQSAGNGFVLGSAISAAYKLAINREIVSDLPLALADHSWVACVLGIKGQLNGVTHYYFAPFGVWRINKAYSSEHDPTVEFEGYDYLGSVDEQIYPWWGGQSDVDDDGDGEIDEFIIDVNPLGTISTQLDRFTSSGNDFDYCGKNVSYNATSGYVAADAPIWNIDSAAHSINSVLNYDIIENEMLFIDMVDNDYNSRDLFALTAAALGCFVHINRGGVVEFKSYDKPANYTYDMSVIPDYYYSYTPNVTRPFELECMQITYITSQSGGDYLLKSYRDYYNYRLYTMSNTLQISANPLVTESVADEIDSVMRSSNRKLISEDANVTFIGTPFVEMGEWVHLTDTSNVDHDFIVNSMETVFNGGLQMTIACNLPSEADGNNISFDPNLSSVAGGSGGGGGSAPINYSTEETYTGMRWIDGKPIFRYVATKTDVTQYNGTVVSIGILPSVPDTVISVRGMTITPTSTTSYWRPIPFNHSTANFASGIWVQKDNGDIRAVFGGASAYNSSKTVVAIVEYTKDTGEEVELELDLG